MAEEVVLMKGNEAIAHAAIRCGADGYFGYPITPQSEVLETLADLKPWETTGMVVLQAESEVAAINMVYGGAGSGKMVLTSSSSPGVSLKQEGISYLAGAELPCLIVNVMRGGPGLGTIQPSQADYFQTVKGGGHGDYKLIALAPASVQENANMMAEAFDLAEKYRHPVLIASDAAIGQMIEAVEIPEFVEHDINKFDWSIKGCKKGCEQRKIQNVYYTHPDYEGYLSSKYAQMEEEEQRYENIQVEDAEVVLVAYGISSRVSREAVEIARAQGFKLGLIRPITLWPFPKKAFEEAKEAKAFLTVEMNILGQMVDDVKLATEGKYPVEHYGSIFEIPETDGIIAKAKEMLKKGEI